MKHLVRNINHQAIESMIQDSHTGDTTNLEFVGDTYNDFEILKTLASHPDTPKNVLSRISRRSLNDVEQGGYLHYLISVNKSASLATRAISKVKGRDFAPDGTFFQAIALR